MPDGYVTRTRVVAIALDDLEPEDIRLILPAARARGWRVIQRKLVDDVLILKMRRREAV